MQVDTFEARWLRARPLSARQLAERRLRQKVAEYGAWADKRGAALRQDPQATNQVLDDAIKQVAQERQLSYVDAYAAVLAEHPHLFEAVANAWRRAGRSE